MKGVALGKYILFGKNRSRHGTCHYLDMDWRNCKRSNISASPVICKSLMDKYILIRKGQDIPIYQMPAPRSNRFRLNYRQDGKPKSAYFSFNDEVSREKAILEQREFILEYVGSRLGHHPDIQTLDDFIDETRKGSGLVELDI